MKSDYEMELDYQVDLMRATALRSRADELAEELMDLSLINPLDPKSTRLLALGEM